MSIYLFNSLYIREKSNINIPKFTFKSCKTHLKFPTPVRDILSSASKQPPQKVITCSRLMIVYTCSSKKRECHKSQILAIMLLPTAGSKTGRASQKNSTDILAVFHVPHFKHPSMINISNVSINRTSNV